MATIFCFSSTGNSLYTAKKIAQKIGGTVEPIRESPVTCEDSVIGFVLPVFFWGLPHMAESFIESIKITDNNAYVFAVVTCGGPVFGVLGVIKKLLKSKHINLRYGMNLRSVTNYIPEYEVKDSELIRQKTDEKIKKIAGEIMDRKYNRILAFPVLNRLLYQSYPSANSDRFFTVAGTCTGCSTCQKICPAGNIAMNNNKPKFNHRCEHCLACIHNCPMCAVDWKQKTQGKARYRNAGITLDELIAFNNQ